ncbi:transmembrane protein 131-like [Protopterus annectens]|uniref:transmembrane protein 131-like n=1 Tax=Protopterus annectens TaxID=7888 RepID=UPI001CFB2DAC|nr:transmembrane protein 131-like [Protopterus annectens]
MAGLREPPPRIYCNGCHSSLMVYRLVLGVIHILLSCFPQGEADTPGFTPVVRVVELWPSEEGDVMLHTQAGPEQETEDLPDEQGSSANMHAGKILYFQPPVLNFGSQPLGLPKAVTVYASNPSRSNTVQVNLVFTSGRHFHVPPVHKVIPPRGKASFRVIFLPTEEGTTENVFFINTSSQGVLPYQVFGTGVSRAFETVGDKLFSSHLLFPFIQLSEAQDVSSSSHLEIDFETISPLETSAHLQQLCFLEGNKVHLRINFDEENEADKRPIMELKQSVLENISVIFLLTVTTSDEPEASIFMLNSNTKPVHLKNIHLFSQTGTAIVDFQPVLLPLSVSSFVKVSSIFCKAAETCGKKNCSEVKSNIFEGGLILSRSPLLSLKKWLNPSMTEFRIKSVLSEAGLWELWFTGNLGFDATIKEVKVAKENDILKILNFNHPLTLTSGCWNLLSLKLDCQNALKNICVSLLMVISTALTIEIPLEIHTTKFKGNGCAGKITLCGAHSHSGVPDTGLHWKEAGRLDQLTWKTDYEFGNELYERWQKSKNCETCWERLFGINKHVQQMVHSQSPAGLSWPHLVADVDLTLNFSATALWNRTVKYFTLKNPSDRPVSVQLLPLSQYPEPLAVVNLLSKWYGVDLQDVDISANEFRLIRESVSKASSKVHATIIKNSTRLLLQLTLRPGESRKIGVSFTPVEPRRVASLILIRNNMTALDMIIVEGFGTQESLKVGGRVPGSGSSLRFKVPESNLLECRHSLKASMPILSVRKNFKVENVGLLPLTVTSYIINGYNCQGFGFEVLECHPFFLDVNASHEISIVFTPDFTSSWVIRELTLVTATGSEFPFTLNVTLPHHLLPLCANSVPGPIWEESFWMLTVLFACLSLAGVVFIAFQQARYILTEFSTCEQRTGHNSLEQQDLKTVDTLSSITPKGRGSCKAFVDACSSSDRSKGKGSLSVGTQSGRSQCASKRSPGSSSHSQKKIKCSVYYSRLKPNNASSNTVTAAASEQCQQTTEIQDSSLRETLCTEAALTENLTDLSTRAVGTLPQENIPEKKSIALSTFQLESACLGCMGEQKTLTFPKETSSELLVPLSELGEQEMCTSLVAKTQAESNDSPDMPHTQIALQNTSRHCGGYRSQERMHFEKQDCEKVKEQTVCEPSVDKTSPREEKQNCCEKQSFTTKECPTSENAYTKRKCQQSNEKTNIISKKNRTARRNRKRNNDTFHGVSEQNSLKQTNVDAGRQETKAHNRRHRCPNGNWEISNIEVGNTQMEKGSFYLHKKKSPLEWCSSDSCSDCGSSSGSVRASRGSWGSWSSSSSSEIDKCAQKSKSLFFPSVDQHECVAHSGFPFGTSLYPHHSTYDTSCYETSHMYQSSDLEFSDAIPQTYLCPSFAEMIMDLKRNSGLYTTEETWLTQTVPFTEGFEYSMDNSMAFIPPADLHNGCTDWMSAQHPYTTSMYCPFEHNYTSLPEDNVHYQHGFPDPGVLNGALIDHGCLPLWSADHTSDSSSPWDLSHCSSSLPYFSGTRSLSPVSELFSSSIWAPQNDLYGNTYTPPPTASRLPHLDKQAIPCKQECPSVFDPFHTYMNLDIWTNHSRQNSNSQLSCDSGYCGDI